MKKHLFAALVIGLLCCCSKGSLPEYEVIDNNVYDVPAKSQVALQIELKGVYTAAQVKELCEMMVSISSERKMKYHPVPTHIWVYIYKSKADCKRDGSSWVAMYGKAGSDREGEYTYR
jgi:hypothetical protein